MATTITTDVHYTSRGIDMIIASHPGFRATILSKVYEYEKQNRIDCVACSCPGGDIGGLVLEQPGGVGRAGMGQPGYGAV